MAINKVVYGNDTLIDLTEDSVEANNLLEGETAHDRSGNPVTGTAKQGHVVQDDSGTDMTQRSIIQFKGLNVTDDSTNGKTVVEATKTSVGLGNVPNVTTDNQTPTVTEASERENITAGDTLKTIIGKIKKWFTDLPSMFVSKTGDTMNGQLVLIDMTNPIKINRSNSSGNSGWIDFYNSSGLVGQYGVGSGKRAIFSTGDGGSIKILAFTDEIPTDFVPKSSGGTFSGDISVDRQNGTASAVGESRIYVGNATPEGTDKNSYGSVFIYSNTAYVARLRAATNQTAHRNIYLPDKAGTLALTSDFDDITRPSRANVSVLTYATTLSEGIHFYTTMSETADNPHSTASCMFVIFKASTGITIFGLPLAVESVYVNASHTSGSTWTGWLNISDFVSRANGGAFRGNITVDLQNGGADQNNAWSLINLGNNIPKGTAKHSAGIVRLFGHSEYRTDLQAPNSTANRSINLPDKNGTVALTSDIPSIIFNETLGADVLTIAKTMANNSIIYYKNSNKPANRPTNGDYGAYEFIKSNNMVMIKYISNNMTACTYGITDSATSITWHIS